MSDVFGPDGVHLSLHVLETGGEVDRLLEHCSAIEFLTVHYVGIHEDHKRFVVYCTGRKGAERRVPKTWAGASVVRRMGPR